MHSAPPASSATVSLYDARPFFEKALRYGISHGIIDQAKLDAIRNDAPKGMVQIARYFGTEFLRPDLERAKERMVNLISLYLESTCNGDLRLAAESLRDHSIMSRSKGGSDMLKALIAMPQTSHFGMNESGGFTDEHIPLLAKWSLASLAAYEAELSQRRGAVQLTQAAVWLAQQLGMEAQELEEAGKDAEAVIRTALLALALRRSEMPDWVAFEKMVATLRKKFSSASTDVAVPMPKGLPTPLQPVVEEVRQSLLSDLPKILASDVSARKLFDQTPAFMGRYFWTEDALTEVDHFERTQSKNWTKATGGHSDDSSLLTLFVCLAAGAAPKTLLSEKSATALVRKIRKSGLHSEVAIEFIRDHAPDQHRDDYLDLWEHFLDEGQATLLSDMDYQLHDALTLLRRECNVGP